MRPRMTEKVRRGLKHLVTLAESWREADGDDTLTPREVNECDAAVAFVNAGGLSRPTDKDKPDDTRDAANSAAVRDSNKPCRAGARYRPGCPVTLERERHAWDRLPESARAWLVRP